MSNKFYILALDGGGFRGAYSAYLLKCLEDAWNIDWLAQFNLFAGTSTGAIIAAGLAHGQSASSLYNLYAEYGQSIFRKRWFARLDIGGLSSLIASRYSSKKLRSYLHDLFGDTQLKDIPVPLIIPSNLFRWMIHANCLTGQERLIRILHIRVIKLKSFSHFNEVRIMIAQ